MRYLIALGISSLMIRQWHYMRLEALCLGQTERVHVGTVSSSLHPPGHSTRLAQTPCNPWGGKSAASAMGPEGHGGGLA